MNVMQCLSKYCGGEVLSRGLALNELRLDSLDLIESLFELENYYGKSLSNAELASLVTVGDLVSAFEPAQDKSRRETDGITRA